jgi:hypothetical protein
MNAVISSAAEPSQRVSASGVAFRCADFARFRPSTDIIVQLPTPSFEAAPSGATAAAAAKAPPVISNAISKLHMGSIDDLIADDSMFASFPAILPINDLF